MEVKDILKRRRLEKDLTLEEVARRVGVSGGTISRWESGDIANMRRDKIMKLAQALDLSPSVIMGWDTDEPKEEPETTAYHLEGSEALTDDEKAQVEDYIQFVLSKRK